MTKYVLKLSQPYKRVEKKLLKKYPQAQDSFSDKYKNPGLGDIYPGFPVGEMRKAKIGVSRLRMSQSDGFRLIHFVGTQSIVPIYIYKKGKPKQESKILGRVRELLKEIMTELSGP